MAFSNSSRRPNQKHFLLQIYVMYQHRTIWISIFSIEIQLNTNLNNIFYVQRSIFRTSCHHIRLWPRLHSPTPLWIYLRPQRFLPIQSVTSKSNGWKQKENPHHLKNLSTFSLPRRHYGTKWCQIQSNYHQTRWFERWSRWNLLRNLGTTRISRTRKRRTQKTTPIWYQGSSCLNFCR